MHLRSYWWRTTHYPTMTNIKKLSLKFLFLTVEIDRRKLKTRERPIFRQSSSHPFILNLVVCTGTMVQWYTHIQ